MTSDEKILLVERILKDVRNNWGGNVKTRVGVAKKLCEEIAKEADKPDFNILADTCREYLDIKERNPDGRFFREEFPHGYYKMEHLTNLSRVFHDKSDEFKAAAVQYLTMIELAFPDLEAEHTEAENTEKLLAVIDMQNDFLTGSLANADGQAIIDKVADYIRSWKGPIVATRDTHGANYLNTQEGKKLPVPHCILDSDGWKINSEIQKALNDKGCGVVYINKPAFGSVTLGKYVRTNQFKKVVLIGVCTDICVNSNAILIKSFAPETEVVVLKDLCAGVTPERQETALKSMEACQVTIQ